VPRFSWSAKAQALAPKKLYIVDPGIIHTGSVASTKNEGSLLENFIFMELRRLTTDISYFSDNAAECDFIVNAHTQKPLCIQVCSHLNHDNEAREIKGLIESTLLLRPRGRLHHHRHRTRRNHHPRQKPPCHPRLGGPRRHMRIIQVIKCNPVILSGPYPVHPVKTVSRSFLSLYRKKLQFNHCFFDILEI